MKIKDLATGRVFCYGNDPHDSLRISYDGTTLSYYNLQNGEGSLGDYRFVMDDEEIPSDSNEPCAVNGQSFFNIGGFNNHMIGCELGYEMKSVKEAIEKQIPKKPKVGFWTNKVGSEQKAYLCPVHLCPNCEDVEFGYNQPKYCENCGQAIDWSEVE